MAEVFVSGASGFVGRRVVDALLHDGHRVRGLARRVPSTSPMGDVTWVRGDITDPDRYRAAVRQAEYVIHLAAVLAARSASEYERTNIEGTAALLDTCAAAGKELRRLVLVSSLAAMGPTHDGTLRCEADPCRPQTVYGASKLAAERVACSYADQFPITILRPAFVYGRGDQRGAHHLRTLLQPSDRPWKTPIVHLSFVHVVDFADTCLRAMVQDAPSGDVYLVADPAVCSWDDVRKAVLAALETLADSGVLAPPVAELVIGRAHSLDVVAHGAHHYHHWGCDTTKARTVLGFRGTRTLEQGALEAICAFAEEGFFAPERWLRRPTTVV
jgi:nucleoside-diphosphate-sugar epimerase